MNQLLPLDNSPPPFEGSNHDFSPNARLHLRAAGARLYGSPGQAGKYGAYWTLRDEAHTSSSEKATYRTKYAICKAWNDLSNHIACKLPKGVVLQAGPGESVHKWQNKGRCDSVCKGSDGNLNESYKADAALQVVLHNAAEFCDKPALPANLAAAPASPAKGGKAGKKP